MLASLSNEPLNGAERDELRAFLASDAWRDDARRFSGLDELRGFFAAVVCTPEMILPSEWLGFAFGELRHENHAQSEHVVELVLRFYNEVSRDLGHTEKTASWSAPAGGPASANLWCRGFIRGMAVRDDEWRGRHRDDELYRSLLPILAVGGASPDNPLAGMGKTRHDELLALLPQSISILYARMRRLSEPHAPKLEAGNEVLTLPSYGAAELAACGAAELLAMMVRDEDRVPRNVIDEFSRRGAEALEILRPRLNSDDFWSQGKTSGEWWLRLHLVMVLGLLPDAEAGELLVTAMRRMSEGRDEDLQDWFGGYWPALFRNKPANLTEPLRALAEDRTLDWYIRSFATEAVVALAAREGKTDLNAALDWLARLVVDETEDWDMRVCSATTLIEFPRASHRALLETLAKRQKRPDIHFALEEIEEAYALGVDQPGWRRFEDPWQFYKPEVIAARQERWAKEDAEEERREASEDAGYDDDFGDVEPVPYIRAEPKIGRNDPCPCGSGKKFKKCHGAPDAGPTLH